jgi:hypothetical protein
MDPPVPLYNVAGLSKEEFQGLLHDIRSTSYIDEIESGEGPREESPLYDEVKLVDRDEMPSGHSIDELYSHANKARVIILADAKDGKSVLIVETKQDGKRQELRVVPRDVIEVSCNCRIANMDLGEVSHHKIV